MGFIFWRQLALVLCVTLLMCLFNEHFLQTISGILRKVIEEVDAFNMAFGILKVYREESREIGLHYLLL